MEGLADSTGFGTQSIRGVVPCCEYALACTRARVRANARECVSCIRACEREVWVPSEIEVQTKRTPFMFFLFLPSFLPPL